MSRMVARGRRVQSDVSGPSRTKQSFAEGANINRIIAKYHDTGHMPMVNSREPKWGDFSQATDYFTALNRVADARDLFDELPARIRSAFRNDPGELIQALEDPNRLDELVELGLVEVTEDGKMGAARAVDTREDESEGHESADRSRRNSVRPAEGKEKAKASEEEA